MIPLRWDEVDYAANLCTVPRSRMRSGKNHQTPLPDPIDISSNVKYTTSALKLLSPKLIKKGMRQVIIR